jgi:hypothetical protein
MGDWVWDLVKNWVGKKLKELFRNLARHATRARIPAVGQAMPDRLAFG